MFVSSWCDWCLERHANPIPSYFEMIIFSTNLTTRRCSHFSYVSDAIVFGHHCKYRIQSLIQRVQKSSSSFQRSQLSTYTNPLHAMVIGYTWKFIQCTIILTLLTLIYMISTIKLFCKEVFVFLPKGVLVCLKQNQWYPHIQRRNLNVVNNRMGYICSSDLCV